MLSILLLLPLLGILTISFLCEKPRTIIIVSLFISICSLYHILTIMYLFDHSKSSTFQFMEGGILGIDGISLWLLWLMGMLVPIVLLSTWKSYPIVKMSIKPAVICILFINFWCNSVFTSLSILGFYISFEGVLIPMYFLISFYGSRSRKIWAASNSFFIYTLGGSLLLLLSIIILSLTIGSTSYVVAYSYYYGEYVYFLWLGFFLSLAIKIPMIPFHLWLPEAHVESPTGGSVLLAGILLKLGSYGIIRYSISLFMDGTIYYSPIVITMCVIGIIYSSLACLAQWDIKKIIAYSSIAHMNTATLGLFTNDLIGITAGIYFLISHGLISSGLFLLIGYLYDRYNTRTIAYYRGIVMIAPVFSAIFLFFSFANIAVPPTSGFISEILTFVGIMNLNVIICIAACTSIVTAPVYSLWLYHKIVYGSFSAYLTNSFPDISLKEIHLFLPLAFGTLFLGIFPNYILSDLIAVSYLLLI